MKRSLLALLSFVFFIDSASADKVCLRSVRNKITKRQIVSGTCPRGFVEIIDTSTLRGSPGGTGATGSSGVDGALRVWGDGSDGDLVAVENNYIDTTKQYRNIVIEAGTTARLFHGTTVRCTGTLTIRGTLLMSKGPNGGFIGGGFDSGTYLPLLTVAEGGVAFSRPGTPECALTGDADGSGPGIGTGADMAKTITKAGLQIFGANGAGSHFGPGGQGGPSVALYCKSGVAIEAGGLINAQGGAGVNGGGGAGGGIVILASNGTVSNAGTIDVKGGIGGDSTIRSCAGAGGGGGFVHFIGPSISNTGTVSVAGGDFGASSVVPSATIRCGGGGGGGSYGSGGIGLTYVSASSICSSGGASGSGGTITTTVASGSVEALIL